MAATPPPLSFTLFDLEKEVYRRNYKKYEQYLIELCSYLDNKGLIEDSYIVNDKGEPVKVQNGLHPLSGIMSFEQKVEIYNRIASCITAYLSDTTYTPSDEALLHLIFFKTNIASIFYISSFNNMDHILWNRDLLTNDFRLNLATELDIKYLLACYTLNSNITIDVDTLINAIPYWGASWYLGLLYHHHHCLNQRIQENFNKLIASHKQFEKVSLDVTLAELAASPWMNCSYWDIENRHSVKKSINVALKRWAEDEIQPGLKKRVSRYIKKTDGIKRIVVLCEKYFSKHAMYRSYHLPISVLKQHYDVTLFCAEQDFDDNSVKDFHRVITVKDSAQNIAHIVKDIASIEPDLILYPSLGMAKWTIPLCNLRLAKYQVMCYGHPASAMSDEIDYGYSSGFAQGPDYQSFCMEQVIPVYHADHEIVFQKHSQFEEIDRSTPEDNVVRIAINSSLPKISNRFIKLCSIIKSHSSVPLEFHFFAVGNAGCELTAFKKSLQERIGTCIVIHPHAHYIEYMKNLAKCDLAIGTFPFGNANTNIDLAVLGIPKIYYSEECGLASFTDHATLRKLTLPDILKPTSEAGLLSSLIYLIHNTNERQRISKELRNQKPTESLTERKEDDSTLLRSIRWIENKAILTINRKENQS
ncbi:hypothetical protein [Alkalimarinus coralli]|uniref:hypothetical protein n=1 Tax=Alkalimarinus coralli TaxID=2935863 RepID=UPI00202B03C6|nr:hypothetical protein [Alkalimarinus coralli]